jgi:hypothetical protein
MQASFLYVWTYAAFTTCLGLVGCMLCEWLSSVLIQVLETQVYPFRLLHINLWKITIDCVTYSWYMWSQYTLQVHEMTTLSLKFALCEGVRSLLLFTFQYDSVSCYLMTSFSWKSCIAWNCRMIVDKLERMWKKAVVAYFKILSQYLPGESEWRKPLGSVLRYQRIS